MDERAYKWKTEVLKEYGDIICNENGRTQYVLLSKMPRKRLSPAALGCLTSAKVGQFETFG